VDEKARFSDRIIFFLWEKFIEKDMFCGCFKRFLMLKLRKKETRACLSEPDNRQVRV
jgi:hypothetical protein